MATPKSGFHVCFFRERRKPLFCLHLRVSKRLAVRICGMTGRAVPPSRKSITKAVCLMEAVFWKRGGKGEHYKVGNTRHAREAMSDTAAHYESLFHHPGTFVGRQMPSWESGLCLLWQKSFLHGACHPGQSRQTLGPPISVPAKPQLVLALAFTAVTTNATIPCVCQV